jgi:uncharacterized protein YgbK (DUF1537 family)
VSCVTTEMIALHGDALAAHLRDARAQILVADAVTQADLSHVVAAAYAAGIRFFAGSYGIGEALHPFGLAHATAAPVLVVAGSTSEMTRRQVARLASETGCTNVVLRFDPGFFQQPVEDFARRFRERLGSGGDIVIHTSGSFEETQQLRAWARDAGWTAAQLSARIEELLQQLVRPLLATCDGFIFSGGATANAIFKLLGASGLTITGREILPATPLAYVNGGSFHGRPYVTKPGSFGDEEDLVAMMNYVKTERHSQAR